ncbi:MAG: CBS domain-containing protein [Zetaproteobacteria bacterium]|nr:MAG: CBS domain-containing protein [Zetaproteobacteria bacterium]
MNTAAEIMNRQPPCCRADTPISTLAVRFSEEGITGVLVVDEEQRLLGVVTESDLVDRQASLHIPTALAIFDMVIPLGAQRFEREIARLRAMTAGDLIEHPPRTIAPEATLDEIAALMEDADIHHLPVVDGDNFVVGMVTKRELIRALAARAAG